MGTQLVQLLPAAAMVAALAIGTTGGWGGLRSTSVICRGLCTRPRLPVPMSAVNDPLFQDAMVAYKLD